MAVVFSFPIPPSPRPERLFAEPRLNSPCDFPSPHAPLSLGTPLPTLKEAVPAGWRVGSPSSLSASCRVGGRGGAAGETLVSQAQKGGSRQVAGGLDVPPQQSRRQDEQEASWGERERGCPTRDRKPSPAWTQVPAPSSPALGAASFSPFNQNRRWC